MCCKEKQRRQKQDTQQQIRRELGQIQTKEQITNAGKQQIENFQCPHRVHRLSGMGAGTKSMILNLAKVERFAPSFSGRFEAILQNGEKVVISRQYVPAVKKRLGL